MTRSIEVVVAPEAAVTPRGSWRDVATPIALALLVLAVALVVVLGLPSLGADPMAGT